MSAATDDGTGASEHAPRLKRHQHLPSAIHPAKVLDRHANIASDQQHGVKPSEGAYFRLII